LIDLGMRKGELVTASTPTDRTNDESDLRDTIARAQRGDIDAFNVLVERFQRAAFVVALRMLGERELAADVTQDAVLAAYRNIGRFRGGSFRVWLLRIVTNLCLDHWRAQQRRPTVSLDAILAPSDESGGESAPHAVASLVAREGDPAALAEQRELQAAIQTALLAVPEEQRLAVVLCDVEGLSYEEIAQVTQTNIGTVKSRLARGRARLRDVLLRQPELLPRAYRHHSRGEPPTAPGSVPPGTP
jgi:RNA polymerase sigma-70 factor (ECF subfamily)